MKKLTVIYLIRHSESLKLKNTLNEDSQIENEKIILSVNGEKKAKELSELSELSKINVLWCSNYSRAIATAKYIANKNNIEINIDKNFGERKLGNLDNLKKLGKTRKYSFTIEQLLDAKLKNENGESREEVTKRIEKSFNRVMYENFGKRIAIVSHGAAIKFLIMKWCKLNSSYNLEYNNKELIINTPSVIKLIFENEELINLEQII